VSAKCVILDGQLNAITEEPHYVGPSTMRHLKFYRENNMELVWIYGA